MAVRAVLRAALGLLRRRWSLLAVLAFALAILPDVIADAAVDLDDPAMPAALGGPGSALAGALTAAIELSEDELPSLLTFRFDAAVVAVALHDVGAGCGPDSAGRRLLPMAVAAYLLDAAWTSLVVGRAHGAGSALIDGWILLAPVWAAERLRLTALPRRLAELTRGHRRPVAALALAYVVADFTMSKVDGRLLSAFEADRAALVFGDATQAALSTLAGAVAVALYAALRRAERPSSTTLAAFE